MMSVKSIIIKEPEIHPLSASGGEETKHSFGGVGFR
jgi:hypothetical protein